MSAVAASPSEKPTLFDPTGRLVASGNLRRRAVVSRVVDLIATGAAAVAVIMMGLVLYTVISRGAPALTFGFLTHNLDNGGIANALVGTAILVALAAVIAVPLGVMTALYLTEFAGSRSRTAQVLRTALDMMQGLPTIVVALFVFGLIVLPEHQQTGFAGAVALAIVMLPLVARASQEVLLAVPGTLREAADALGVSRWRSVLGVILPAAASGIATGAILATARVAGETAPLLICNLGASPSTTELNPFGHAIPSIPLYIYTISDIASRDAYTRAWGAAFVLMAVILLANIGARVLLARSRAKMRG